MARGDAVDEPLVPARVDGGGCRGPLSLQAADRRRSCHAPLRRASRQRGAAGRRPRPELLPGTRNCGDLLVESGGGFGLEFQRRGILLAQLQLGRPRCPKCLGVGGHSLGLLRLHRPCSRRPGKAFGRIRARAAARRSALPGGCEAEPTRLACELVGGRRLLLHRARRPGTGGRGVTFAQLRGRGGGGSSDCRRLRLVERAAEAALPHQGAPRGDHRVDRQSVGRPSLR
mmetsp:Transcript_85991/g.248233  ORF Transcript_85991/g.248233 Transcript_85991/m.248233 type:complete len:229 (+) Transcript_85991:1674-2360(+)